MDSNMKPKLQQNNCISRVNTFKFLLSLYKTIKKKNLPTKSQDDETFIPCLSYKNILEIAKYVI